MAFSSFINQVARAHVRYVIVANETAYCNTKQSQSIRELVDYALSVSRNIFSLLLNNEKMLRETGFFKLSRIVLIQRSCEFLTLVKFKNTVHIHAL